MARDGAGVAAGLVGVGIGFGLYLLISGLGFGGGGRGGHGELGGGGHGEGGGGIALPPAPPVPPYSPILADKARLTFVMIDPTVDDPSRPASFRGPDGKMYALDELIARVRAGGRSDVTLKIRGDVRAGSASAAKAAVSLAGIKLWEETPRVSGCARGHYGRSVA